MNAAPSLFPNPYDFINTLCDPGNLFILGAGASAEFMPTGNSFLKNIGTVWLKGGGFSVRPGISRIAQRLSKSGYFSDGLDAALIGLIPDRGSEWIVSYLLSPSPKIRPFLSYDIFKRIARPFTIVNYNHDALARVSIKNMAETRILEPHGSTFPGLKELFDELEIQEYADLNIPAPNADNFIMLRPEPSNFSNSPFFRLLDRTRNRVRNVFFIGYSFSLQSDGSKDDAVSYEYFTDYLPGRNSFVVMPHPQKLVEEMSDQLHARSVLGIPLRWDVFSRAIFACGLAFNPTNRSTCLSSIPKIFSTYISVLDSEQSKEGIT
jgi:hypothetical protein